MMLTSKRFSFFLFILLSIVMLFSFSSCNNSHVHTEKILPEVAPTCTSSGLSEGKICSTCNAVLTERTLIPQERHFFGADYKCVTCGKELSLSPCENLKYTLSDDGKYYIVSGKGDCVHSDVVIPKTHNGLPVKKINRSAFRAYTNIKSVFIPEGITSIGQNAFYGCKSLDTIWLPSTLKSIDSDAFYDCERIKQVEFFGNITQWCNISFATKTSSPLHCSPDFYLDQKFVIDLVIPSDVTSINKYAFCNVDSLLNVTISNGVTSIGYSAFYGCSSLKSVSVPESVTHIGNYAFSGCSSLTTVNLSEGLTHLGRDVFYSCDSLENVYMPNSLLSMEDNPFDYCKSFTFVEHKGLYYIGNPSNHFLVLVGVSDKSCSTYAIHEDTKLILGRAFFHCAALERIVIPKNIIFVGESAFKVSDSLKIYCEAAEQPSGWDPFWVSDSSSVTWSY